MLSVNLDDGEKKTNKNDKQKVKGDGNGDSIRILGDDTLGIEDSNRPLRLRAGWRHDWYTPSPKEVSIREIVPGPFKHSRLVANSPFVVVNTTKKTRRGYTHLTNDPKPGRRCANLRTGIPDPWAEYLAIHAVNLSRRRIQKEEQEMWSDHLQLTKSLWKTWGLHLGQGIPDPWKHWPKSSMAQILSEGKTKQRVPKEIEGNRSESTSKFPCAPTCQCSWAQGKVVCKDTCRCSWAHNVNRTFQQTENHSCQCRKIEPIQDEESSPNPCSKQEPRIKEDKYPYVCPCPKKESRQRVEKPAFVFSRSKQSPKFKKEEKSPCPCSCRKIKPRKREKTDLCPKNESGHKEESPLYSYPYSTQEPKRKKDEQIPYPCQCPKKEYRQKKYQEPVPCPCPKKEDRQKDDEHPPCLCKCLKKVERREADKPPCPCPNKEARQKKYKPPCHCQCQKTEDEQKEDKPPCPCPCPKKEARQKKDKPPCPCPCPNKEQIQKEDNPPCPCTCPKKEARKKKDKPSCPWPQKKDTQKEKKQFCFCPCSKTKDIEKERKTPCPCPKKEDRPKEDKPPCPCLCPKKEEILNEEKPLCPCPCPNKKNGQKEENPACPCPKNEGRPMEDKPPCPCPCPKKEIIPKEYIRPCICPKKEDIEQNKPPCLCLCPKKEVRPEKDKPPCSCPCPKKEKIHKEEKPLCPCPCPKKEEGQKEETLPCICVCQCPEKEAQEVRRRLHCCLCSKQGVKQEDWSGPRDNKDQPGMKSNWCSCINLKARREDTYFKKDANSQQAQLYNSMVPINPGEEDNYDTCRCPYNIKSNEYLENNPVVNFPARERRRSNQRVEDIHKPFQHSVKRQQTVKKAPMRGFCARIGKRDKNRPTKIDQQQLNETRRPADCYCSSPLSRWGDYIATCNERDAIERQRYLDRFRGIKNNQTTNKPHQNRSDRQPEDACNCGCHLERSSATRFLRCELCSCQHPKLPNKPICDVSQEHIGPNKSRGITVIVCACSGDCKCSNEQTKCVTPIFKCSDNSKCSNKLTRPQNSQCTYSAECKCPHKQLKARPPICNCSAECKCPHKQPKARPPICNCSDECKCPHKQPKDRPPICNCLDECKCPHKQPKDRLPNCNCSDECKCPHKQPKDRPPICNCSDECKCPHKQPKARTPICNCSAECKRPHKQPKARPPICNCSAKCKCPHKQPKARPPICNCSDECKCPHKQPKDLPPICNCSDECKCPHKQPKDRLPNCNCSDECKCPHKQPKDRPPICNCSNECKCPHKQPKDRPPICNCSDECTCLRKKTNFPKLTRNSSHDCIRPHKETPTSTPPICGISKNNISPTTTYISGNCCKCIPKGSSYRHPVCNSHNGLTFLSDPNKIDPNKRKENVNFRKSNGASDKQLEVDEMYQQEEGTSIYSRQPICKPVADGEGESYPQIFKIEAAITLTTDDNRVPSFDTLSTHRTEPSLILADGKTNNADDDLQGDSSNNGIDDDKISFQDIVCEMRNSMSKKGSHEPKEEITTDSGERADEPKVEITTDSGERADVSSVSRGDLIKKYSVTSYTYVNRAKNPKKTLPETSGRQALVHREPISSDSNSNSDYDACYSLSQPFPLPEASVRFYVRKIRRKGKCRIPANVLKTDSGERADMSSISRGSSRNKFEAQTLSNFKRRFENSGSITSSDVPASYLIKMRKQQLKRKNYNPMQKNKYAKRFTGQSETDSLSDESLLNPSKFPFQIKSNSQSIRSAITPIKTRGRETGQVDDINLNATKVQNPPVYLDSDHKKLRMTIHQNPSFPNSQGLADTPIHSVEQSGELSRIPVSRVQNQRDDTLYSKSRMSPAGVNDPQESFPPTNVKGIKSLISSSSINAPKIAGIDDLNKDEVKGPSSDPIRIAMNEIANDTGHGHQSPNEVFMGHYKTEEKPSSKTRYCGKDTQSTSLRDRKVGICPTLEMELVSKKKNKMELEGVERVQKSKIKSNQQTPHISQKSPQPLSQSATQDVDQNPGTGEVTTPSRISSTKTTASTTLRRDPSAKTTASTTQRRVLMTKPTCPITPCRVPFDKTMTPAKPSPSYSNRVTPIITPCCAPTTKTTPPAIPHPCSLNRETPPTTPCCASTTKTTTPTTSRPGPSTKATPDSKPHYTTTTMSPATPLPGSSTKAAPDTKPRCATTTPTTIEQNTTKKQRAITTQSIRDESIQVPRTTSDNPDSIEMISENRSLNYCKETTPLSMNSTYPQKCKLKMGYCRCNATEICTRNHTKKQSGVVNNKSRLVNIRKSKENSEYWSENYVNGAHVYADSEAVVITEADNKNDKLSVTVISKKPNFYNSSEKHAKDKTDNVDNFSRVVNNELLLGSTVALETPEEQQSTDNENDNHSGIKKIPIIMQDSEYGKLGIERYGEDVVYNNEDDNEEELFQPVRLEGNEGVCEVHEPIIETRDAPTAGEPVPFCNDELISAGLRLSAKDSDIKLPYCEQSNKPVYNNEDDDLFDNTDYEDLLRNDYLDNEEVQLDETDCPCPVPESGDESDSESENLVESDALLKDTHSYAIKEPGQKFNNFYVDPFELIPDETRDSSRMETAQTKTSSPGKSFYVDPMKLITNDVNDTLCPCSSVKPAEIRKEVSTMRETFTCKLPNTQVQSCGRDAYYTNLENIPVRDNVSFNQSKRSKPTNNDTRNMNNNLGMCNALNNPKKKNEFGSYREKHEDEISIDDLIDDIETLTTNPRSLKKIDTEDYDELQWKFKAPNSNRQEEINLTHQDVRDINSLEESSEHDGETEFTTIIKHEPNAPVELSKTEQDNINVEKPKKFADFTNNVCKQPELIFSESKTFPEKAPPKLDTRASILSPSKQELSNELNGEESANQNLVIRNSSQLTRRRVSFNSDTRNNKSQDDGFASFNEEEQIRPTKYSLRIPQKWSFSTEDDVPPNPKGKKRRAKRSRPPVQDPTESTDDLYDS